MLKIKHSSKATFGIQAKAKESKSNQIILCRDGRKKQ